MAGVASSRVALALGAWAALAAGGADARAAPQTFVALEYEVAPEARECPDAEAFRASVARQLHYDPFRPTADRRVVVRIIRKEAGFDGQIRWADADGQSKGDRRLSSKRPDCGEIAAGLAFSVVVQIQLLTTLAPPAPLPPDPAAPPPAPAPPPAAAPQTPSADVSPAPVAPSTSSEVAPPADVGFVPLASRLTWSAGLGPALALGVASEPIGLARIFVSGRVTRLSLELAIDAAWPAAHREVDGSGFSLDRFATGAAACGHARAFAACVTATFGVLRARGAGIDAPAAPSGLFSQVGARAVATIDLGGRYFAAAHLDGLVMVSSWTVTLNGMPAWTTPRVGGAIGADFGARFF